MTGQSLGGALVALDGIYWSSDPFLYFGSVAVHHFDRLVVVVCRVCLVVGDAWRQEVFGRLGAHLFEVVVEGNGVGRFFFDILRNVSGVHILLRVRNGSAVLLVNSMVSENEVRIRGYSDVMVEVQSGHWLE